jgi:O-antigen/teichoic acid export membrane protein
MRVAMAPQISRLLALGDLRGAGALCAVATQWIVLLAWPLYLVLALYAPYVLALFGPGFDEGATALTVLALAMIVVMSAGNNQTVLLMSGRSGAQLRNKAVALAVDLGLNLLLVPSWGLGWGMRGAAVAWAVTVLLDATLVLAQVRWSVGVRIPMSRVRPAMLLAATAFVPPGLAARLLLGTGSSRWPVPLAVSLAGFAVLLHRYRHLLDVEPLRRALPGSSGSSGSGRLVDRGGALPPGRPGPG